MFHPPHGELHHLIATFGYAAVAVMIAVEGIGFPLPGETTLIAAAILSGTEHSLDIRLVIAAAACGAIAGGIVGFWIGRAFGYRLMLRYGHYIGLTEPRIKLGQYLFLRYGGAVVFGGRFVAVLRPLAALLAGINRMSWRGFLIFNAAGSVVWAAFYGVGAYVLGREIHHIAGPVGLSLGAIAVAGAVVFVFVLRRHEADLTMRAEAALPGPLQSPGRG